MELRSSEITITINKPGWIIKGVVLHNEHLFNHNGGHYVQMNSQSSNSIKIHIKNDKNNI